MNKTEAASGQYAKRSAFKAMWKQLRKNKGAMIGLVIIGVIVAVAVISQFAFDYEKDIIAQNVANKLQHPSLEHPFGTDALGRDVLGRVAYGARYSLAIGVVSVMIALVVGVMLGAAAGYIHREF